MRSLLFVLVGCVICSQVLAGTFFSFTHGKQADSTKPKDTSEYGVTDAELQELCELVYGAQTPVEELNQLLSPALTAKLAEVCQEKLFKRPRAKRFIVKAKQL